MVTREADQVATEARGIVADNTMSRNIPSKRSACFIQYGVMKRRRGSEVPGIWSFKLGARYLFHPVSFRAAKIFLYYLSPATFAPGEFWWWHMIERQSVSGVLLLAK